MYIDLLCYILINTLCGWVHQKDSVVWSSFYKWENQDQKGEVTCLRLHSNAKPPTCISHVLMPEFISLQSTLSEHSFDKLDQGLLWRPDYDLSVCPSIYLICHLSIHLLSISSISSISPSFSLPLFPTPLSLSFSLLPQMHTHLMHSSTNAHIRYLVPNLSLTLMHLRLYRWCSQKYANATRAKRKSQNSLLTCHAKECQWAISLSRSCPEGMKSGIWSDRKGFLCHDTYRWEAALWTGCLGPSVHRSVGQQSSVTFSEAWCSGLLRFCGPLSASAAYSHLG